MIHPKSSYIFEDERHFYGPGLVVRGKPTVRVGDRAGTWSGYFRVDGLLTLVAFSWGIPPATLAVPFGTRGDILK
jgi:hypothetical protein